MGSRLVSASRVIRSAGGAASVPERVGLVDDEESEPRKQRRELMRMVDEQRLDRLRRDEEDTGWVLEQPLPRARPTSPCHLWTGTTSSIRPSFLMPSRTAHTEDVQGPLFLRTFGVPFWALAHVFGRDPMDWYRLVCGLGRFSVVGTTVRQAEVPAHLLADEHHQPLDGQKVYIATTVADGCCLGAEPAATAGTDDLKAADEVFKDEARDIAPESAPKTVSTDGWKGTHARPVREGPAGDHPSVFLARVAQDPGSGPALERTVRGRLPPGLGGVPTAGASGNGSAGCGSGQPNTSGDRP